MVGITRPGQLDERAEKIVLEDMFPNTIGGEAVRHRSARRVVPTPKPFSDNEIRGRKGSLRSGKTSGPDGIPTEALEATSTKVLDRRDGDSSCQGIEISRYIFR